jgi:hypothetical protein
MKIHRLYHFVLCAMVAAAVVADDDKEQQPHLRYGFWHPRGLINEVETHGDWGLPPDEDLDTCDTKYPIVLVGGKLSQFPRQLENIDNRFQRLELAMRDCGAEVFTVDLALSDLSDCASIGNCAVTLKSSMLQILAVTGAAKVNIVGLLDAGLVARYMITNLGLASKTATLTTVNSPHRGSPLFNILADELDDDYLMKGYVINLKTDYMRDTFNPNTPNKPGVYYQSYSSHVEVPGMIGWGIRKIIAKAVRIGKFLLPSPAAGNMLFTGIRLLRMSAKLISAESEDPEEGSLNDGVSTVESQKWGTYVGDIGDLMSEEGINAFRAVAEFNRATWDVEGLYSGLAGALKTSGY